MSVWERDRRRYADSQSLRVRRSKLAAMTRQDAAEWIQDDVMMAASNGVEVGTWLEDRTVRVVARIAGIGAFGLRCAHEMAVDMCTDRRKS